MASNTVQVATLHTYADAEWVAKYGAEANHEIASIVNSAEAIYEKQLGVRFKIVGQSLLPEETTSTEPGAMLKQFTQMQSTQDNEVDLKHLFTGKNFDGATIGIAYIGAVCWSPNYSYGISQDYPYSMTNIFAHEIGHNFNAMHDTTSPSSLMYPSIHYGDAEFSQKSLDQINSHLFHFGSCLSTETVAPNLSEAKLSIRRRGRTIKGTLTYRSSPLPSTPIILFINNKIRTLTTDASGTYTYTIRKPKKPTKYIAYTQTSGAETTSRAIRFKL
jgi:hypothetical protein